jgi:hypothetical protein
MRQKTLGTVCLAAITMLGVFAAGCGDSRDPVSVVSRRSTSSLAESSVTFTVGPLALSALSASTPGHNLHLRDVALAGAVTGDVVGTANFLLNADLDGMGNGPTWGTVTITSGADVWQGNFSGHFLGDLPVGILLSSQVTLHGPDQQLLKAECDEIPPSSSETLACSGTSQSPHE